MFRPVLRSSSCMSIQKYYKDISFCINIPKDNISICRNIQHIRKGTIWVKIQLFCVRLNICGLSPRGIRQMFSQTIFINFRSIRQSLATKSLTGPRFRGVSVTNVLQCIRRSLVAVSDLKHSKIPARDGDLFTLTIYNISGFPKFNTTLNIRSMLSNKEKHILRAVVLWAN